MKTQSNPDNPRFYKHFNACSMSFSINNQVIALHDHSQASFTENDFSKFYRAFFDYPSGLLAIGKHIETKHVFSKALKNRFPIFSFDLSRNRTMIIELTISMRLQIGLNKHLSQLKGVLLCLLAIKKFFITLMERYRRNVTIL